MEDVDVLWKISSMRYESKHTEGKKIVESAIVRLNVCYTIALREQLCVNHRFLNKCYFAAHTQAFQICDFECKSLFLTI